MMMMMLNMIYMFALLHVASSERQMEVGDVVVNGNHRQAIVDGRNSDNTVDLIFTDDGSYRTNVKTKTLSIIESYRPNTKESPRKFESVFVEKLTHSQSNLLHRLAKLFHLEKQREDHEENTFSYSLLPSFDESEYPSSTFDQALLDLHGDLSKYYTPSASSAKENLESLAKQGHSSAQRTLGLLPPSSSSDGNEEARRVLLLHFASLASDPHAQLAMGYRHMYVVVFSLECMRISLSLTPCKLYYSLSWNITRTKIDTNSNTGTESVYRNDAKPHCRSIVPQQRLRLFLCGRTDLDLRSWTE